MIIRWALSEDEPYSFKPDSETAEEDDILARRIIIGSVTVSVIVILGIIALVTWISIRSMKNKRARLSV